MTIALALIALVVGVALLEVGADRFTDAIGGIARRLRASESVVGLLTAGGEWEELVVVVLALTGGHPGLAVGNIIGSCIANLTGSLPLGFLGRRPLVIDRSARIYAVVMVATTILAASFLASSSIEPIQGGILVVAFILYVVSILLVIQRGWLRPSANGEAEEEETGSVLRLLAFLAIGLLIVSIGAEIVVQAAVYLAEQAGLSDYAIGATAVALGTTLPDKAITLVAGRRGQGGVVTANATGSNIFLLTLVLGVSALFNPTGLVVAPIVAQAEIPILVAVSALIALLFLRRALHRRVGLGLLSLYLAYLGYVLMRGG